MCEISWAQIFTNWDYRWQMQRRAGGTCCGAGDGDASELVVEETSMAMRGALRDCERVGW